MLNTSPHLALTGGERKSSALFINNWSMTTVLLFGCLLVTCWPFFMPRTTQWVLSREVKTQWLYHCSPLWTLCISWLLPVLPTFPYVDSSCCCNWQENLQVSNRWIWWSDLVWLQCFSHSPKKVVTFKVQQTAERFATLMVWMEEKASSVLFWKQSQPTSDEHLKPFGLAWESTNIWLPNTGIQSTLAVSLLHWHHYHHL